MTGTFASGNEIPGGREELTVVLEKPEKCCVPQ